MYRTNVRPPDPPPEPEVIIDARRFLPKWNIKYPSRGNIYYVLFMLGIIAFGILGICAGAGVKTFHGDCFKSKVWHHQEIKPGKYCSSYTMQSSITPEDCKEWHDTVTCEEYFSKAPSINITKMPRPPWE